jgi:hypothetical protein
VIGKPLRAPIWAAVLYRACWIALAGLGIALLRVYLLT